MKGFEIFTIQENKFLSTYKFRIMSTFARILLHVKFVNILK